MSRRIDWLYDPTAHKRNKTESEKMNEPVDISAAPDAAEQEAAEEERVSADMMEKIKLDPLFAIRRAELRKQQQQLSLVKPEDERQRQTRGRSRSRSRSPVKVSQDRQKRLREILQKSKSRK